MRTKNREKIQAIIDYINDQYFNNNNIPSYREIAEELNMTKSSVFDYIEAMEQEGLIHKCNNRGIETKKIFESKNTSDIAVIGTIACGTPILAEQNIDGYVSMSKDLVGDGILFALKAKGDSMINAGIHDGDLVIVRQQSTAEEGQIIVALCDNCEATLKRYYLDKKKKKIRLHPENDEMEDMYFDNIDIQGIAVSVMKSLL